MHHKYLYRLTYKVAFKMDKILLKILLRLLLLNGILAGIDFPQSLKHDYKLSLKYPYNNTAIGFKVAGDVFFSEKFIRLAPSIPHKSGFLLSERKIEYDNVLIDVSFAVNGRGFVGGNGIGVWITNDLRMESNSFYGGNDNFHGISFYSKPQKVLVSY